MPAAEALASIKKLYMIRIVNKMIEVKVHHISWWLSS